MKKGNSLMKKNYDAIIVGAGPAGCSAAIFLARNNFNVCLMDKETFPRDKTCGDGLGGPALNMLHKIGVLGKIEEGGYWPIEGMLIASSSGHSVRHKGNASDKFVREYGMAVPRKILDDILLNEVKSYSNVDVLEGAKVVDLLMDNTNTDGVIASINSQEITIKGRFIIGADGAHSIVGSNCCLHNRNQRYKAISVRAYYSNVSNIGHAIEVYYNKELLPGYGWILPTGKSTANVGVILYNRFKAAKNITAQFHKFINETPLIKDKFAYAEMQKNSYKGWPLPLGSFPGRRSNKNVLLIGDAASFIDPVTGEGIYKAMRSGELAADAISKTIEESNPPEHVSLVYENLWKKEFKFFPGYVFQYLLSKPSLVDFGIKTYSKNNKLFKLAWKLAGPSFE